MAKHNHMPQKVEFTLAIAITVLLVGSLLSERYLKLPFYYTTILLIAFLALKIHHIIKEGGSFFEDYASIFIIAVFGILQFIHKSQTNTALIAIMVCILLYSAGLLSVLGKWFKGKNAFAFIISYAILVIMIVFLFAGIYYNNPKEFKIYGEQKEISFEDSLYFSTVTFTTVGFGDITPIQENKIVAAMEAYIGVIFNIAFIGYILTSKQKN